MIPAAVDECRLIDMKQAQKMFGISRTTLWRLRNNQQDPLPVIQFGRTIKFRLDQLLWWLDKHAK